MHDGPPDIDGARGAPRPRWTDVSIPLFRHPGEDDRDVPSDNSPRPGGGRNEMRESPAAIRAELGIPEPGSGQGSFDFYSPFDFMKEMKKARKKVAVDTMKHELHKNWDRGYGVVCNRGDGWFLCKEGLPACNERYAGLCRYAERGEAKRLSEDILF